MNLMWLIFVIALLLSSVVFRVKAPVNLDGIPECRAKLIRAEQFRESVWNGFCALLISLGFFAALGWGFYAAGLFDWEEMRAEARKARIEQKQHDEEARLQALQQQAENMKLNEAKQQALQQQAKAEDLRLAKAREFALHEAPVIWETYQRLGSEIESLTANVEKLRTDMVDLGRNPENDQDYLDLKNHLREMGEVRKGLISKLEDACVARAKADATPGRADSEALWKKAQEDGIQEAEAAERRFLKLKEAK